MKIFFLAIGFLLILPRVYSNDSFDLFKKSNPDCLNYDSVKLNSDEDKIIYTMGVMLGANLKSLQMTEKELALLYKGLSHSSQGLKVQVDTNIYQPKIADMMKSRMSKTADENKIIGQKFIEDFRKNPKVKTTPSGLSYLVTREGSGPSPLVNSSVEIHYHGTLVDGTIFDSSVDRKKAVTFPVVKVIPGWTEALQLMKEGGKYKVVVPSGLAYGDAGSSPKIPGGATLVFDIELFKVSN